MKAVYYDQYGTADNFQLKEVDKPIPRDNEVLIKVCAASINSWDYDLLKGTPFLVRIIGGLSKPKHKILGADVAGLVEATGKNVTAFKAGDAVYGDIAGCGFGGFAEYVSVPDKLLTLKSPAMSFEQAASIPQAWFLAIQGLRYGGDLKPGQGILINGAGGGVGTLALQYAKLSGATVTCVDKPEKFDLLRSLGADYCIDYTKEDYTHNGKQYDLILDVIAHRSVSDYKRALKPGGTFSMIGGSMGNLLLQLMVFGSIHSWLADKKLGIMGYRPNRNDLEYINRLFEEGKIAPVIDSSYPLEQVPDAFRYFGTGSVRGKIVITI